MSDYPLGVTLDFKFTTRQSSNGQPFALAAGSVVVFEDNNPVALVAGITLTPNFDAITGLNQLRVVCTGGNGYESGKSYAAVLIGGTVNGVTVVGEVLEEWTLERSSATVRTGNPATGTLAGDISVLAAEVADIPNTAEFQARTLVAASYSTFDESVDAVANVTTVGVTVVNTDMRGTNNAATQAEILSDGTPIPGATVVRMTRPVDGVVLGTCAAGSTLTELNTSSLGPPATRIHQFASRIVTFDRLTTSVELRGQSAEIITNTATGEITISALTDAPVSGDTFTIQ